MVFISPAHARADDDVRAAARFGRVDLIPLAEPVDVVGLALREAELRPARRRVYHARVELEGCNFCRGTDEQRFTALERFADFISVSHVCDPNVVGRHALLDELVPARSVSYYSDWVELVASR